MQRAQRAMIGAIQARKAVYHNNQTKRVLYTASPPEGIIAGNSIDLANKTSNLIDISSCLLELSSYWSIIAVMPTTALTAGITFSTHWLVSYAASYAGLDIGALSYTDLFSGSLLSGIVVPPAILYADKDRKPKKLKELYTAKQLISAGYNLPELLKENYSDVNISHAGFSNEEIQEAKKKK